MKKLLSSLLSILSTFYEGEIHKKIEGTSHLISPITIILIVSGIINGK